MAGFTFTAAAAPDARTGDALRIICAAAAQAAEDVAAHVHAGDHIATEGVHITPHEELPWSRWLTLRLGDKSLTVFVPDADTLRTIADRLHHAALEMDLVEAALLRQSQAVLSADVAVRDGPTAVVVAS